jgi:hypothetical protein
MGWGIVQYGTETGQELSLALMTWNNLLSVKLVQDDPQQSIGNNLRPHPEERPGPDLR